MTVNPRSIRYNQIRHRAGKLTERQIYRMLEQTSYETDLDRLVWRDWLSKFDAVHNEQAALEPEIPWDTVTLGISLWQAANGLVDDGMFGPRSASRLAQLADGSSALASEALRQLEAMIGEGEVGGNNAGPFVHDIAGYPKGRRSVDLAKSAGAWCAFLQVRAFKLAAAELGINLPWVQGWFDKRVRRTRPIGSAKSFGRRVADCEFGTLIIDPHDIQPLDVVVWDRGTRGSPAGHVGLAFKAERDNHVWVIDGNIGDNAKVDRRRASLRRFEFAARLRGI